MPDYDAGYKRLFSHPELVRDLLTGFVDEAWVAHLDLDSLERVDGSYVTDDLRSRESDIVWRARWGGRWLYVYLLIEFQSRPDRYMAVRMLGYLCLLYQDLIRGKQLPPDGRLPPVFPVVLYNGERPWGEPARVEDLVHELPGGLGAYVPRFGFRLLEEVRLAASSDLEGRNLAAAVFRLEASREPEDLRRVVRALAAWLRAPGQAELRRSLTVWLRRVLEARLEGVQLPQTQDLEEVDRMLAERIEEWTRRWKEEGRKEGLEEGRKEGLEEGRKEGLEEGRKKGLEQGRAEAARALLRRLLERKFGPLPTEAAARIETAQTDTLVQWTDRVLTASTLEAVFEPPAEER